MEAGRGLAYTVTHKPRGVWVGAVEKVVLPQAERGGQATRAMQRRKEMRLWYRFVLYRPPGESIETKGNEKTPTPSGLLCACCVLRYPPRASRLCGFLDTQLTHTVSH